MFTGCTDLLVLTQQRQRIVNKNRVANFKNTRITDITNSKFELVISLIQISDIDNSTVDITNSN